MISSLYKGLSVILTLIVFLTGCKKDNAPDTKPTVVKKPPTQVTVSINTIGQTNAVVNWTLSKDSSGGTISYTVTLGKKTIVSNTKDTQVEISDLLPNTTYQGQIKAESSTGLSSIASFSFTTHDTIIRFENSYLIAGTISLSANRVLPTPDKGYIIDGLAYTNVGNGRSMFFQKLDSLGNEQWHSVFPLQQQSTYIGLQQTTDGYIGVSGSDIIKVDLKGNKVWDKIIDMSNLGGGELRGVVKYINGYIVVGQVGINFALDKTGNIISQALAISLDLNGNIIWQKQYGSRLRNEADDVICDTNGDFYLVGVTEQPGFTYQMYLDDSNLERNNYWWFKIDKYGTMLWEHLVNENDYFAMGARVVATPEGNFGYIGTIENYWQSHGLYNMGQMQVFKFDPSGNQLNETIFSYQGVSSIGTSIAFTADGGFIATGRGDLDSDRRLLIYKYDANWNQSWAHYLDAADYSSAVGNDVIQTKDNGYMIVGWHSPGLTIGINQNQSASAWALKMDANGVYK